MPVPDPNKQGSASVQQSGNCVGAASQRSVFLSAVFLFLLSAVVKADDIDIFVPDKSAGLKPNVLLVLDFSGSMNLDIYGDRAEDSGLESRYDILVQATDKFLDDNVDRLNVGYSIFRWTGSGIRWPITPLNELANTYDPDIPATTDWRVVDVVKSEIANQYAGNSTDTVGALVEAALYFQGGPVTVGGLEVDEIDYWEPDRWEVDDEEYDNGYNLAPNRITYVPQDAYKVGVSNGSITDCDDYTLGGTVPDEENECLDVTAPMTCVYEEADSGTNEGGDDWSDPAHYECEYEHPDSWTGADYVAPSMAECQRNIILLVSDGEPDGGRDFPEKELVVGHSVDLCEDVTATIFGSIPDVGENANCAIEIAAKLYSEDQNASVSGSNVETYTIGFNTSAAGQEFLQRVATAGGGKSYLAHDLEDLSNALNAITADIINETQSFSPLSVDVNRASFSHDNRAFVSLFKPSVGNAWRGNLKGYFLDKEGLLDVNGNAATKMDGGTMVYSDTAQSFWSLMADGADVEAGGASGKLDPATRKLYTFTGTSIPAMGIALKSATAEHDIALANAALTPALMGVSTATDRDAMIDWLRNAPMGDALHSQSVTVNYGTRTVVYQMTNQGLFHAFDATSPTTPGGDTSGGSELFAFMPPELLPNLMYLSGTLASTSHIYGLDGQITRWHSDLNGDGVVNGSDTILLVFGQRRGGNHYYALDVTNPENPVYKWKITGGVAPFEKLAQTWSDMSLVTVNYGGNKKRVLAFGGGYDATVNDPATIATAGSGNSVFIVDENGSLLWAADTTGMDYSIPSDLTIIDASDDGMADRIYVGDLGGNIWRIDMDDVSSASSMHVTKFAALDNGAQQPFFYPPSVSLESSATKPFLSIAIGSGNRANPLLAGTSNRIYALRDKHIEEGSVPADFTTVTLTDLYNATSNLLGTSDADVASAERIKLNASSGWYVELAPGEKVLSGVSVFEGRLLTTTMTPAGSAATAGACGGVGVQGSYYSMAVNNAVPIDSASGQIAMGQSLPGSSRSKSIRADGIPNTPSIVALPGSPSANVMVDQRIVDTIIPTIHQVYWYPED